MKFKIDLKNKIDLAIIISGIILITTGAFLRFFKYFLTPVTLTNLTMILIPEFLVFLGLIVYKIWRI